MFPLHTLSPMTTLVGSATFPVPGSGPPSTRGRKRAGATRQVWRLDGKPTFANPPLAAAVAEAGGLGMVSVFIPPVGMVAGILDAVHERTAGVVGGNIILRYVEPARVRELVEAWS